MKIWTSEHTFNHPWEVIAQATWKKYPNPINTAILGTDVLERRVVDGILHSHRLVSSIWGLPRWLQNVIGPANTFYASEHSAVNPTAKSMVLNTRNVTFRKYITVDEFVSYEPHPECCEKTVMKQEAVISVEGVPFSDYVEDLICDTIMVNANKGRQAIEWVIENIKSEIRGFKRLTQNASEEL
ncbi:protein slowmo [Halyomorpha halys]|uniref:protein slowmo n=1 Tax=Halyomorpha halys TaxID=286706 RepID=UPI0006D4E932|nr:protein slowmo-like [Halyomorpha halys]